MRKSFANRRPVTIFRVRGIPHYSGRINALHIRARPTVALEYMRKKEAFTQIHQNPEGNAIRMRRFGNLQYDIVATVIDPEIVVDEIEWNLKVQILFSIPVDKPFSFRQTYCLHSSTISSGSLLSLLLGLMFCFGLSHYCQFSRLSILPSPEAFVHTQVLPECAYSGSCKNRPIASLLSRSFF